MFSVCTRIWSFIIVPVMMLFKRCETERKNLLKKEKSCFIFYMSSEQNRNLCFALEANGGNTTFPKSSS